MANLQRRSKASKRILSHIKRIWNYVQFLPQTDPDVKRLRQYLDVTEQTAKDVKKKYGV